jgi:uncharacterized membrane protein YphA (DoxX/SURF4 family)
LQLCVGEGARRYALQRLFSTFPGGSPGIGLLLLRATVGIAAVAASVFYLAGPSLFWAKWPVGLILAAGGSALTLGILTPIAGGLAAMCFAGVTFSVFPVPACGLPDGRFIAVGLVLILVAIVLLGPGAFSLDGYLFGRREIVIPPASRSPEP